MRDDQRKNLPDSSAVFPSASGGHDAPPSTARHPLDDEAERLCCMISDLRPVSYTHLDVYKRQS